jgi:hypothetical protein
LILNKELILWGQNGESIVPIIKAESKHARALREVIF